jgi:uncharacterized repeat protein (TIGR01451 family)
MTAFRLIAIGIVLLALQMLGGGDAGAQSRIITNGGFDLNLNGQSMAPKGSTGTQWVIPSRGWEYFDDSRCVGGNKTICIAGWETTHGGSTAGTYQPVPKNVVETTNSKSNNTPVPRSGNAEAELNADRPSRLYQNVCLQAGETINFAYYYSPETSNTLSQQVRAGIWPRGHLGPTGGALAFSNGPQKNAPTTRGWELVTATLTAPSSGVYQIGFEAVLPASGSAGNELDDVSILLKPLVDLGGSPVNSLVIEPLPPNPPTPPATNTGGAIKVRINGRVPAGGMVLALRLTGTAVPDTDFRLGTPTGPYGTPSLTHTAGTNLWLVNVPAGDYDAGLTAALGIGGITIPFFALSDLLIEDPEAAVLTLQNPGTDGSSASTVWLKGDPVCSATGTTQESASYTIRDNTPTMVLSGKVYADENANNARDGTEKWASVTPLSSTVFINVIKNNVIIASQSVPSGDGAWSITLPVDSDYTVVLSDSGTNVSAAPPLYWQPKMPLTAKYTGVSAPQTTLDFGLVATKATDPVILVKSFADGRLQIGTTTTVRFQINNSDGNPARSGISFTDSLPAGLTLMAGPTMATPGCLGTVTAGTGNQIVLTGGGMSLGTAFCVITATVRGDTLGTKLNDNTRLSNTTGIYSLVDASVWVGTFFSLSGSVYNDANANAVKDGSESGTGVVWQVKLTPRSGGVCGTPVQATSATAIGTGAYSFPQVPAGDYCVIVDNNGTLSDVTSTTPGWLPIQPPAGVLAVSINVSNLANQNLGLFQGGIVRGRVFLDVGQPVGSPGGTANNGVGDGGSETGLAAASVRARAGATTYASAVTDGDGNYTLYVPAAANGSALLITESNLDGYRSTGASVGTTALGAGATNVGGTNYGYARPADEIGFTFVSGLSYGGLNFGDVPDSRLNTDGAQGASPGSTLIYSHSFVAGSAGDVTFAVAGGSTPSGSAGWAETLFFDADCNGAIDGAGDTVIAPTTVISMTAGQQICLIQKEFVPPGVPNGTRRTATVTANFIFTNAAPALTGTYSRTDTTTVGDGNALALVKQVRKVNAACAALPSPDGDWSVSNQASPGSYLEYRVQYQNNSSDRMRDLVITDTTPPFTSFVSAACGATPNGVTCTAPSQGAGTAPAAGQAGQVRWTFTNAAAPNAGVIPGGIGDVTFCVQVQP